MPRWRNKHRQLRSLRSPGLCRQSAATGRRRATCRGAELYGLAVETAERPGPPAVGDGMDGSAAKITPERDCATMAISSCNGAPPLRSRRQCRLHGAGGLDLRRLLGCFGRRHFPRHGRIAVTDPKCGDRKGKRAPLTPGRAIGCEPGMHPSVQPLSTQRRALRHKVLERPFFFIRQLALKPHTSTLFNSKFQNTRVY